MERLWQDVKYGCRVLRRSPVFTLAAVGILALGIGGSSAIFTLVYSLLLKPLPYADPDRLVRVYETFGKQGGQGSVSVANLYDWRKQNRSFSGIFALNPQNRNIQNVTNPERVEAIAMEPHGFAVLGVQALRGRTLIPEDQDQPVAVLSEALWRGRYGGDEKLIGKQITLDGRATTVVGVMPKEFAFPPRGTPAALWLPIEFPKQQRENRGSHYLAVVARLKDGVSLEQASADMKGIAAKLEKEFPSEQSLRSVMIRSLGADGMDRVRRLLWTLFGAVGMVFLIACLNVANLLLVRATRRSREVAIRAALGGGRAALVRQFLVESLLISCGAALLGSVLAIWGLDYLVSLGEDFLPRTNTIAIQWPVIAFLTAVSILGGLLFGLVPAFQGTRVDLNTALKAVSGRGVIASGSSRLRMGLVAGEVALSLVLLIGAGLLMRTLTNLYAQDLGFRSESLLTMRLSISEKQYPDKQVGPFWDRLVDRLRAIPGVQSAGLIQLLPLQSYGWNGDFEIKGRPKPRPGQFPFAEYRFLAGDYFATMGIPVLRGRNFRRNEPENPGAVIINQTLARRYFANEDPIGQRLMINGPEGVPIVGVVADTRQWTLNEPPRAEMYIPAGLAAIRGMSLAIRSTLPPEQLTQSTRAAIREIDPNQPVFLVRTMNEVVKESVAQQGKLFVLMLGLAGLAVVLAVAGIWGVIAYLVEQRMPEFGIRLALGAGRLNLLAMVMREALWMIGPGLIAGLAASLAVTRVLESFLFAVKPADPVTLAGVALMLLVIALGATLAPARRALKVDPIVALRYE